MPGGRSNAGLRRRHALQLFKTDMCKFFLQSRCENGDQCSYAHNISEVRRKPDLTRTSMCRTLIQGGTCTDAGCRFAHSEEQLRATHGFFKMKMCGFAQSGRCKHGKSCRFAHSPEELRPAKPPLTGEEDEVLLARQPPLPMDGMGLLPEASGVPPGQQLAQEGFNLNSFIFGVIGQDDQQQGEQVMQPPEPMPGTEVLRERRLHRRQAAAAAVQQQQQQHQQQNPQQQNSQQIQRQQQQRQQQEQQSWQQQQQQQSRSGSDGHPPSEWRGLKKDSRTHGVTWNESDSADGSSWGSGGSSATEVPRSEHTGSPPTTSDCSSRAGKDTTGTQPSHSGNISSSGGAGQTSASSDQRSTKTQGRRPMRDTEAAGPTPGTTTLLITNIPAYLTQGAVLSMFEDLTCAMRGNFDFYYCPWDERKGHNLGYALINFVDVSLAASFQQAWSNKLFCCSGRAQKPLKVQKATVQGFASNVDYFSRIEVAPCSDLRFRPLYRNEVDGTLQPLPLMQDSSELPYARDTATPPEDSLLPEPPPTILAVAGPASQRPHRGAAQMQAAAERRQMQQAIQDLEPVGLGFGGQGGHGHPRRSGRRGGHMQEQQLQQLHQQQQQQQQQQQTPAQGFTMGGPDLGSVYAEEAFWGMKPQDVGTDRNGAQVLTWPFMMAPMAWPMTDQQQKNGTADGEVYQGGSQEMMMVGSMDAMAGMGGIAAAGGDNGGRGIPSAGSTQEMMLVGGMDSMGGMGNMAAAGNDGNGRGVSANSAQVQYSQLMPYMMMQAMPAGNMHMMQSMAVPSGWPAPNDEVYTD